MKIKVCGMRDPENIRQAEEAGVDLMGFIFYEGSSRFVEVAEPIATDHVRRVGVFVNEEPERILEITDRWNIRTIQLHGDESPDECSFLIKNEREVIKAFPADENFDFGILEPYVDVVDFFLFDTKGAKHGGNGVAFDWHVLEQYDYKVPFFLSGGIHPGLCGEISRLELPMLYAVDVNSGFEVSPGLKNIDQLKKFSNELQGR